MPYAVPSPSTSPVATMTFAPTLPSPKSAPLPPPVASSSSSSSSSRSFPSPPPPQSPQRRDAAHRPARHHQRSHSSEPIASTSSFIFVQPASPENQGQGQQRYTWASTGAAAGSPSKREDAYATVPRQTRRIRLAALTPKESGRVSPNGAGSSSPGPSSQDEGEGGVRGRKEGQAASGENDRTPRPSDSIFTNSFPFGPNSSSPSPSPTPDDDAFAQKPALMVRKKSGELVRPSLKADTMRRDFSKPRSAPATPVCPKYVHFDTQLEHVKHFLAQQRPAAVSRSGSPVETETEDEPEAFPFPAMATAQAGTVKLVLPNFPAPATRLDKPAFVESLEMTPDSKSIRGIVRVKNLAFQKWVAVRFTLDNWQTVSEVSAEHHDSLPGGQADRFAFTIRLQDLLARIEEKTMFLAVRYTVGGQEIWDNNDNQNYRIEFRKLAAPPPSSASSRASRAAEANAALSRQAHATAAERRKNAWSVTNAGQAADRMADLRRELDRLVREDNFDDDDEREQQRPASSSGLVGSSTGLGIGANGGGAGGRRFGPDARSSSSFEGGSAMGMGPASLSGRYDFGNSLKMYTDKAASVGGGGGGGGGGMKPREGGSPSLNVPLPLPHSSNSFFDPVSTSPQRPRAPPLPSSAVRAAASASASSSSPPQPFATTIINGMPATVYDPSSTSASGSGSAPSSMIINSHRNPATTDSPLHSPRPQLQPDFGLPSTSVTGGSIGGSGNGSTASGVPSKAYYSPTLPSFQHVVPRSPPRDPSASSYFYMAATAPSSAAINGAGAGGAGTPGSGSSSPYLPLQDVPGAGAGGFNSGARTRYHSYPVGSAKAGGGESGGGINLGPSPTQRTAPMPYSPLVPPSFRDGRNRHSPFASPVPSPPMGMSPSASPPRPHSPLPGVSSSSSLSSSSSVKLRSPPPERSVDSLTNSDSDDYPSSSSQLLQHEGLWSPATTDSGMSTSTTGSASSSSSSNSAGTTRGGSLGMSPFLPSRLVGAGPGLNGSGGGRRVRDGSEDSTASSLLSSPESDATSVPPDSPGGFYGGAQSFGGDGKALPLPSRPSNALEFSHFLDRYRFHLQSSPSPLSPTATSPTTTTSSLGLSAPSSLLPSPTPTPTTAADFFAFAASASASSPVPISGAGAHSPASTATSIAGSPTPPRRLSPLAQQQQHQAATVQVANGTTVVS
ncbi:hypothetical protein JCM6882_007685 [Rhodosporidiobolus microsporus]